MSHDESFKDFFLLSSYLSYFYQMAVSLTVVPLVTFLNPFEVSLVPLPSLSRLILSVEHRRIKRFFRLEIAEGQIPSLTKGLCQTCQQLFDLLSQIIGFLPMDPDKYRMKLTEIGDHVDINVMYVVFHPSTPRQYDITFQLLHVTDAKYLETKMNDQTQQLNECLQYITKWTLDDNNQRYERAACFDPATSLQIMHAEKLLLNDHRATIASAEHASNSKLAIATHSFHIPKKQRYVRVSFTTYVEYLTKANTLPTILVGILWQHSIERIDVTAPLEYKHAWWFSVHSGRILNGYLDCRDYASPVKEFHCVGKRSPPYRHRVDVLLDTTTRRVAFRVDGQDTDAWAFTLPDDVQINQLYPVIFIDGDGCSITIDP
jgi:hypothetical protein